MAVASPRDTDDYYRTQIRTNTNAHTYYITAKPTGRRDDWAGGGNGENERKVEVVGPERRSATRRLISRLLLC